MCSSYLGGDPDGEHILSQTEDKVACEVVEISSMTMFPSRMTAMLFIDGGLSSVMTLKTVTGIWVKSSVVSECCIKNESKIIEE